ncbi:Tex family protein [Dubosiella newyorkensis]|uniref:Tex family protein n=2 Tax=Dubosiella newyorkensis TaxID=1862672 RepID=UPI002355BCFB|nr:Tex family protein [Dubosiella newyorkensis]MCI9042083.1 RNA-binding transcriptional accessory protein [Dubosiella newyorkensis]
MQEILKILTNDLGLPSKNIQAVLDLLQEGATIPFIARYRKEKTGNMNEDQIKEIESQFSYQNNLMQRKEDVIRLIEEKGLLNEELRSKILNARKLVEVEDLYRPYKEKKKTKASEAIAKGLLPLAEAILSQKQTSLKDLVFAYSKLPVEEALEGAGYIIAEKISEDADLRALIRDQILKYGSIASKIKKDAEDPKHTYEIYYDFSCRLKRLKHFQTLALNRGEKEKILNVHLEYDLDSIQRYASQRWIRSSSPAQPFLQGAIKDALKRLILPSIQREIRSMLSEEADDKAIQTFSINLEHLLLTRPFKKARVLGFDPAFRTGCKLAVLDENGNVLAIDVIYPTAPHNDFEGSKKKIVSLLKKYNVDLIAIGNGTASRESERFVSTVLKEFPSVKYVIVSEAGASVYSASKLAQEEFPDLSVEKRSAISIGRRIQDPLSELVKIEPKSIGVGEYQHDVNQKKLQEMLDFTTQKIVNQVGVPINTASKSILSYVSGLNKRAINALYAYKEKTPITSRKQIREIRGISDATYEQCVGFLRIPESENILDRTGIHPESYSLTQELLDRLGLDLKDRQERHFLRKLAIANIDQLALDLKSDPYTIQDIIKELSHPGRDVRETLEAPLLKSGILELKDLTIGMKLEGTVRNVVSFGAFVDIGLHEDGLVHISKLADRFVSDPNEIVHVGDIVSCTVIGIDPIKERVQLSLL